MLLPERRNELTYSLRTRVGTTGRYHNESLDSLTIILLYGSFLKIVISIYSLIIVFTRLVMFIKRICYVMLCYVMLCKNNDWSNEIKILLIANYCQLLMVYRVTEVLENVHAKHGKTDETCTQSAHQLILVCGDGSENSFRENKRLVFFHVYISDRWMTSRERSPDQVNSRLVLVHWIQYNLHAAYNCKLT